MQAGLKALRQAPQGERVPLRPGGELVEVGLAERDGAGVDQPLHDKGMARRRVGKFGAAGGGGHAGQVDVVLDGEGNAVERQRGRIAAFERAGIAEDGLVGQAVDPHGVGIVGGAAVISPATCKGVDAAGIGGLEAGDVQAQG
jgi:hypothetical protein